MVILVLLSALIGAGTALSPCALPVLPALLSAGATGGRRRPLAIVLGLSPTFLLSIIGGGELLRHLGLGGTTLRNVGIVVLVVAGVAAIVPGIAQRLERPLAALSRLGPRRAGDGFWSGLVVGGALGFVYAPCAGPVLAAVVSVSAVTGRTVAVALAYVAGSAVMLGAIALGGRRVLEPLRRAGPVARAAGARRGDAGDRARVRRRPRHALRDRARAPHVHSDADRRPGVLGRGARTACATCTARRSSTPTASAPRRNGAGPKSELPDLGTAPDFTGTQRWFNTQPLSLKALRGRVVLIDFWTYTCINCLRTLPYLEAWDKRYRSAGLTIVGVHARSSASSTTPATSSARSRPTASSTRSSRTTTWRPGTPGATSTGPPST